MKFIQNDLPAISEVSNRIVASASKSARRLRVEATCLTLILSWETPRSKLRTLLSSVANASKLVAPETEKVALTADTKKDSVMFFVSVMLTMGGGVGSGQSMQFSHSSQKHFVERGSVLEEHQAAHPHVNDLLSVC